MVDYKIIVEQEHQTVMAHYEVEAKPAETEDFMERAFADGYVTETGTGIAHILPPPDPD